MKKILNIKIYFGIELILRYNTIFNKLLDKEIFEVINVSLDKALLLRLRGQYPNIDEFYAQYYTIMKWIFQNSKINVVDDQSFELIYYRELIAKYGEGMTYYLDNNLIDQSLENILDLPPRYITISTKIWGHDINAKYDQIKSKVIDILNFYNYKILILGEKKIASCDEYNNILTKSIYSDLIQGLKNYEDYTYDDSSKNNEMNGLKRSFYILNKSSLNVFMTDSGIRIINLFLNSHLIGLTNCYEMSIQDVINYHETSMCFTNDPNVFVTKLQQFIQRHNE